MAIAADGPLSHLPALSANWEGDTDGFQIAGFVSPGPRYLHLEKACLLVECRAENISLHKYINLSFTSHEILYNKKKTQRNRSEYFFLGLGRESAYNSGNLSSIPGLGRSLGEDNGNPLQCSCLENPTDRGAWWATVHRVTESDTTEQLTHIQE